MAEDPKGTGASGPDGGRFLATPLEAGEIRISVQVTEGATLTPQMRVALDCLAKALEEEEMQRYALRVAETALKVQRIGQITDFDTVIGTVSDCDAFCNNQCGQQCASSNGSIRILPVGRPL